MSRFHPRVAVGVGKQVVRAGAAARVLDRAVEPLVGYTQVQRIHAAVALARAIDQMELVAELARTRARGFRAVAASDAAKTGERHRPVKRAP